MVHGIMCTRKFCVLLSEKSYLAREEVENHCDPFAVAVVRSGVIVGHTMVHILMFLGPAENELVTIVSWSSSIPTTMATPPANRMCAGRNNLCTGY